MTSQLNVDTIVDKAGSGGTNVNNLAEPFISNDRATTAYQSNMYDVSYIDSAQNTMASGDLA
jgi:hypothetical protein